MNFVNVGHGWSRILLPCDYVVFLQTSKYKLIYI